MSWDSLAVLQPFPFIPASVSHLLAYESYTTKLTSSQYLFFIQIFSCFDIDFWSFLFKIKIKLPYNRTN